MNKTKKECIYKGCSNTNITSEKTLFRFPTHETKQEEWIKRSNCDKSSLSTLSKQFLCEDHFDSIYITSNQRRKLLLSTAVPYPYGEIKNICEEVGESDIEEQIDETPQQKKLKLEYSYILDEVSDHEDYEVLDILEKSEENQEEIEVEQADHQQDLIVIEIQKEVEKPQTPVKPQRDLSLVTTFIFKGEEYIQMPKDMYDQQEADLKDYLKMDFQQEQKSTEAKVKILEDAVAAEKREKDMHAMSYKSLLKKYQQVVEQNKMYKSAVTKAKEALLNIPE